MKVGYEVKMEGEIWECILGGSNTAVFQKKIKLQKKINIKMTLLILQVLLQYNIGIIYDF